MGKLVQLTDLNIENFVTLLKDSEILVYENLQGSKLFFNYDGGQFQLKCRSLQSDSVNKIDLAIQKYYAPAFRYLEALDERAKKLLPRDWWFCCEFFYDTQPSHIRYDKLPQNNLMLTSIVKGKRFTYNSDEIKEYASLLNIDHQPLLYKGRLTNKQLGEIRYFLSLSLDDVDLLFGERNFSKFFYELLSPATENSLLMNTGTFQENIDKLIIRLRDEQEISFAILNPLHEREENTKSEFVDSYTILLMDFLEFMQMVDLDKIKTTTREGDQMYLDIVSQIFNMYCHKRKDKIINFDFVIPSFFNDEKFRVNLDMITNQQTRTYIERNDKLEYMFRIVVSSFRIPKKKSIGVFTDATLTLFNNYVNQIRATIDKQLQIQQELNVGHPDLMDFEKFFSITYPKDANDEVYPDLYKELDNSQAVDKKKKMSVKK